MSATEPMCLLCSLGEPAAAKPAIWMIECKHAAVLQSVYSCQDHYEPIVNASQAWMDGAITRIDRQAATR